MNRDRWKVLEFDGDEVLVWLGLASSQEEAENVAKRLTEDSKTPFDATFVATNILVTNSDLFNLTLKELHTK